MSIRFTNMFYHNRIDKMITDLETAFNKNRWAPITQRMGIVTFEEIEDALKKKGVDTLEHLFPAFWDILEENKWNIYHIDGAPSETEIALKIQESYGKPVRIEYNVIETSILCDKLISSCKKHNYNISDLYATSEITKDVLMKHINNTSLTKKQFMTAFWDILEKEDWSIYDDDNDVDLDDRLFVDSFYDEF